MAAIGIKSYFEQVGHKVREEELNQASKRFRQKKKRFPNDMERAYWQVNGYWPGEETDYEVHLNRY